MSSRALAVMSPCRTVVALLACASTMACEHKGPEVSIAAATSLRAVMPELMHAYDLAHPGSHSSATYGASGELRQQIEAGAPVDVVVFAGERPVDELIKEGRVDASSRRIVATNELVLVGTKGGPPVTFETLLTLPDGDRVAVGDPRTVPAGEYARDYLSTLGEWDALQPRVVTGANVGAVLVYARRGEVAAAIVYATELRGVTDLVVKDTAHGDHAPHPKVVAAAVHGGRTEGAEFVRFLSSSAGGKILASFGFGAP